MGMDDSHTIIALYELQHKKSLEKLADTFKNIFLVK